MGKSQWLFRFCLYINKTLQGSSRRESKNLSCDIKMPFYSAVASWIHCCFLEELWFSVKCAHRERLCMCIYFGCVVSPNPLDAHWVMWQRIQESLPSYKVSSWPICGHESKESCQVPKSQPWRFSLCLWQNEKFEQHLLSWVLILHALKRGTWDEGSKQLQRKENVRFWEATGIWA